MNDNETYLSADVRLAEMERAAVESARELVPVNGRLATVFAKLADAVRAAKREVVNAATMAAM